MFTTVAQGAFDIPVLLGDGVRAWRYVFRELALPWFHVSYRIREDACEMGETVCIDRLESLLEFESLRNQNMTIDEVQLVSPGWLNGTDRWMMEPLKEVMRGQEPDSTSLKAHIFVVHGAGRYLYSTLGTKEADLRNVHRVFPTAVK